MTIRTLAAVLGVLGFLSARAAAGPRTWTLTNHAGDYRDELVRLKVPLARDEDPARLAVTEDGQSVPFQVEGRDIWVCTTIAASASHTYEVKPGTPAKAAPLVTVKRDGAEYLLDNGLLAVRVWGGGVYAEASGPITAIRPAGGAWIGASRWHTQWPVNRVTTEVLGAGPLFAKVKVTTECRVPPNARAEPPRSEITITLMPGQPLVHVEESHAMHRDDFWAFECTRGWKAGRGLMRRWQTGPFRGIDRMEEVPLAPGQTRLGDVLLNLQPRWTQGFDEGWFFGATDGPAVVGAVPVRAGRWYWGHDNLIRVRLKVALGDSPRREGGGYAALECPTWRGRRSWLLVAGPRGLVAAEEAGGEAKAAGRRADPLAALVARVAFQPLDKLTNEYILEWPGQPPGGFRGDFFYSSGTNPTGGRRGMGRNAIAGAGNRPGDRRALATVQVNLDPDWFSGYWQKWSPINPNFHTDFIKYPVGEACNLAAFPRFEEVRRRVEDAVRTDLYFAVTLPGGAGQECPGYLAHSMGTWKAFAEVGRKYLKFDMTEWPRYRAAASFLARVSPPAGGGQRLFHPGGDTHPRPTDPVDLAREFGVEVDPKALRTEELPGFGAVLRSRPGTDRETYLAFKSGPNRGHYHGDQLSLHYCAGARPVAVDHHCSYHPRAGQEHMHNRVAFCTDDWPYANMDGFERLIAFRADDPDVDAAVGQVESPRLRKQLKLPPEDWDAIGPLKTFDRPLVYRRTVLLVKGRPEDYVVLRDEYAGPGLTAVYCLHVLAETIERDGRWVRWPNLSLFCAAPKEFAFEAFPWEHSNGGREHTEGARLSAKGEKVEFITVLYPGAAPPKMAAAERGVALDFGGGSSDRVEFLEAPPAAGASGALAGPLVRFERDGKARTVLSSADINLDRPQGEVGLFIPDVGYVFGHVPEWLERQRDTVPDWHVERMGGR